MIQNSKVQPTTQICAVSQNKMIRKCLKTLMHRLLHQYRSQSYDSNGILTQYYLQLQKIDKQIHQNIKQTKQQQNQSRKTNQTNQYIQIFQNQQLRQSQTIGIQNQKQRRQRSSVTYYNKQQFEELKQTWQQISVFMWQMTHSPKWYVEMLRNEQIYAQQSQCIDMHVFTTKIYKKVIQQSQKMTKYTKQFQKICADQIYFFLQQVSLQICQCFKLGQRIVINQLNYATSIVEKSQILNFYLLYKIFKDISWICRHRIINQLQQGIFRCIQVDVLQNFALYIIQKYQILDMQMDRDRQSNQDAKQKQGYKDKIPITQRILNNNNIKWREAIRQDGQIGILVELQDQKDQQKSINYMLTFDENGQMNIVNSNSLNLQWKVCKKAQTNYDIKALVKNKKALAQKFRTTSTSVPLQMTLLQNIGVVGGSMGKCLAQIDNYDNVGDFMVSLSKRTVIGGSFNYLLMQVPLLGYVFVTGGFTYTFYYIFSNKYANTDKKMREIRNITIGSATSVSSGIIGAMVGQTLIPVPMVGAFIGGLVGGFLGEFSVRSISKIIENKRFKQTIQQMKDTIQPKGYWNISERTLNILQIKKQKFYETIPKQLENKMNCDRIWLTIILFTLLCFFESKQRIKTMEKWMKQKKQLNKKMDQYQIIQADQQTTNENKIKQYEPSVDFMCIIRYFQDNQIIYINFHDDVVFLLNKVFARLK